MPRLTIIVGVATCACNARIVVKRLHAEFHNRSESRLYSYCTGCGLIYDANTIQQRREYREVCCCDEVAIQHGGRVEPHLHIGDQIEWVTL